MQTTFFSLGRFLKKLADDQCSSITKGSIYHIKHIDIQPFIMGVDWPEIGRLMEASIMFDICTYCLVTLYGRRSLATCTCFYKSRSQARNQDLIWVIILCKSIFIQWFPIAITAWNRLFETQTKFCNSMKRFLRCSLKGVNNLHVNWSLSQKK